MQTGKSKKGYKKTSVCMDANMDENGIKLNFVKYTKNVNNFDVHNDLKFQI